MNSNAIACGYAANSQPASTGEMVAAPNKSIAVIYEIYLENFDMAVVHYLKYIALGGSDGDMVRKWVEIARERGRAR